MMPSNDIPLYNSEKKAVIPYTKKELIKPENVNQNIDKGNGMFILKPDLSVNTEFVPAPLFVDRDKLIKRFPDKANKILSDIENKNPLSDEVAQVLITENIIADEKPAEFKKPETNFLNNIVNTIYNLIFS